MSNKRMKIENLENLQEVTTEEFSSIQGGLSVINIHEQIIIGPDHPIDFHPKPLPHPFPIHCHPKPIPRPWPIDFHPKPIEHPISIEWKHNIKKDDIIHIGWCPFIL